MLVWVLLVEPLLIWSEGRISWTSSDVCIPAFRDYAAIWFVLRPAVRFWCGTGSARAALSLPI